MAGNLDQLVAAAKRGDPAAREAILAAVGPVLAKAVERRRAARMAARFSTSDVVQSALLRVHRDFSRFEVGGWREFLRWARTYAIHHLRQVERMHLCDGRDIGHEECREDLGADPREPGPDRIAEAREAARQLEGALARLGDAERAAVVMGRLEGRSHAEIAAAVGGTIAASRTRLKRALVRLRAELARENGSLAG